VIKIGFGGGFSNMILLLQKPVLRVSIVLQISSYLDEIYCSSDEAGGQARIVKPGGQ
jgi:hypothetical protein